MTETPSTSTRTSSLSNASFVTAEAPPSFPHVPSSSALSRIYQTGCYYLSAIFFFWLNPLFRVVSDTSNVLPLDTFLASLAPLRETDRALYLEQRFHEHFKATMQTKPLQKKRADTPAPKRGNVWKAILKTVQWDLCLSGLFTFMEVGIKFGEVFALSSFLKHLSDAEESKAAGNPHKNFSTGFALMCILVLMNILKGFSHHHMFFVCMRTGMKVRTVLMSYVVRCMLRTPNPSRQFLNLISHDVAPFEQGFNFFHTLWSGCLELLVAAILLYESMGGYGCFFLILLGLSYMHQYVQSCYYTKFKSKVMAWRDQRIQWIQDWLFGIQVIKCYNWQAIINKYIHHLRRKEIKQLRNAAFLDATSESFFFLSPTLFATVTFTTALLVGLPVTLQMFYFALALYNVLALTCLNFVPKALKFWSECRVCAERIRLCLLQCPSLDTQDKPVPMTWPFVLKGPQTWVWGPTSDKTHKTSSAETSSSMSSFRLYIDRTHVFPSHTLVGIGGPVGSGKSSLLQALLGDMPGALGQNAASSSGTRGYVPASPWLMQGSVADNIVFGRPYDAAWLAQVVRLACLDTDLAQWDGGLQMRIQTQQSNVSGGQKMRLNLARALYAKPDLLLLDDVVSALDVRIAQSVMQNLRWYTRNFPCVVFLATHHSQFLMDCDTVCFVQPNGLLHFVPTTSTEHCMSAPAPDFTDVATETAPVQTATDGSQRSTPNLNTPASSAAAVTLTAEKDTPYAGASARLDSEKSVLAYLDQQWTSTDDQGSSGQVTRSTVFRYLIKPHAWPWLVVLLVLFVLTQASLLLVNWILTSWILEPSSSLWKWLFLSCLAACLFFTLTRGYVCAHLLMRSAQTLSKKLLESVSRAPLVFFHDQGAGPILNRFNKDQSQLDELFPPALSEFLKCSFMFFGALVFVGVVSPYTIIPVPFLLLLSHLLRRKFLRASLPVKRWESALRSPIYAYISMCLEGVPVIRAFHCTGFAQHPMHPLLDLHSKVFCTQIGLARWLGLRMDLLMSAFFAVLSLVVLLVLPDRAGLALVYATQLSGLVQWTVRQSVESEVLFINVARILDFCDLKQESEDADSAVTPSADWPSSGHLDIRQLSLTYPHSSVPALRDFSSTFAHGTRIGLVGRTGAGKSSFLQTLFRFYPFSGEIRLDGINIAQVPLSRVRRSIALLPQHPFLFKETLRFNLDPTLSAEDAALWRVLDKVRLKSWVEMLPQKLDTMLGKELSQGQQQLVCLARALLRDAPLLLLDEAYAHIDFETERAIQTILADYPGTLLSIAHRLESIVTCDEVIVLDQGTLVGKGHAYELYLQKHHVFYSFLNECKEPMRSRLLQLAEDDFNARKAKKE